MLLMTSNGLTSRRLRKAAKKALPAGAKRAALVTTASVGFKEKDYHVPWLRSELERLGLSVDFFDFDQQPASRLFAYQVVECIGGNPFYLVRRLREAHCEPYLQGLKSSGLLIGVSAGSLAMQESLELVDTLARSSGRRLAEGISQAWGSPEWRYCHTIINICRVLSALRSGRRPMSRHPVAV